MNRTLIFDGDCAFCSSAVAWLGERAEFTAKPWQRVNLGEIGLRQDQVETAVWLIDTSGVMTDGADAISALLRGAYARRWQAVGAVMSWPVIRSAARIVYRWVARHRHLMPGGTPACALTPDRLP